MRGKLLATLAAFLVAVGAGTDALVQKATEGHPRARRAVYRVEDEATRLVRKGFFAATGSCGVERWRDKVLTDPAAATLDYTPRLTNVPKLRSYTAPPFTGSEQRTPPVETTTWKLSGVRVVAFKLEADSDFHLVLQSTIDGSTMIGEIPDPGCAVGSAKLAAITQARDDFVREVGVPTGYYHDTNVHAVIVGVGLDDFVHGQRGVAPSGVEVHPIFRFKVVPW